LCSSIPKHAVATFTPTTQPPSQATPSPFLLILCQPSTFNSIISGPFRRSFAESGGRKGRGRRRSISSTDFPPVAAAGAQRKAKEHFVNRLSASGAAGAEEGEGLFRQLRLRLSGKPEESRTREPELQALVSVLPSCSILSSCHS